MGGREWLQGKVAEKLNCLDMRVVGSDSSRRPVVVLRNMYKQSFLCDILQRLNRNCYLNKQSAGRSRGDFKLLDNWRTGPKMLELCWLLLTGSW